MFEHNSLTDPLEKAFISEPSRKRETIEAIFNKRLTISLCVFYIITGKLFINTSIFDIPITYYLHCNLSCFTQCVYSLFANSFYLQRSRKFPLFQVIYVVCKMQNCFIFPQRKLTHFQRTLAKVLFWFFVSIIFTRCLSFAETTWPSDQAPYSKLETRNSISWVQYLAIKYLNDLSNRNLFVMKSNVACSL